MRTRQQWVLRTYTWFYLYRQNILHAPGYCVSILSFHTSVGVVDEHKRQRCVYLKETRFLLCRNAKWLQAVQFTLEEWVILLVLQSRRLNTYLLDIWFGSVLGFGGGLGCLYMITAV